MAGGGDDYRDAAAQLGWGRDGGREPDEASEPEAAPPSRERPSTPAVAPTVAAPVAAASPAPFLEHMGPETYPGRLRGIYGGSLWLEPDFQGMQWPHNTQSGLGISANFWVDSGREAIKRGTDQLPNTTVSFQQGRSVLRLTPAYVSGNLFVQAQMELVGNLCQATTAICLTSGTFTTDDLWIRVGAWNAWDVKVGRFEAWEVYHLGMGLEQYTLERLGAGMFGVDTFTTPRLEAPTFYGVTYLHDRPSEGLAAGKCGRTSISDGLPALRAARQAWLGQLPRRQRDRRYAVELFRRPPDDHLRRRLVQAPARRRIPEAHGDHPGDHARHAGAQDGSGANARAEGRGRIDPVRDRSDRRIWRQCGDRPPR